MKNFDILIIGGGASGMFAAISAAMENPKAKIAILEKGSRVGRKLLATGNGRCNLSNYNTGPAKYHGENVKFVLSALSRLDVASTLDFFSKIGIITTEESDGKIFPKGLQASSVLDLLRLRLKKLNIPEITDFEAVKIKQLDKNFSVFSKSGDVVSGNVVIVCVGGWSGPQFGTDGSGFNLLENFGHSKTPVYPALTKLKTNSPWPKTLKGIKFNGSATLKCDGKVIRTENGEVLFTDYGLSGPPILQISGEAAVLVSNGKKVTVSLDLMPEKSTEEVALILGDLIGFNPDMPLEYLLSGILNKQIGKMLIKVAEIGSLSQTAFTLKNKEILKISSLIKCWDFEISATTGFKDAQTTMGGVKTSEFSPSTMESRIVKNLFAAGEIFDVCGDCGGYNLQWAWSSGYLAGTYAAKSILRKDR